jgi:hypothetical protein
MRVRVQEGGRYLAALMVASMLLWSLSLVLAGQADAMTGQETTSQSNDGGDNHHRGDHDGGDDCPSGSHGKTGGGKDDCDHDGGDDCPSGSHGKTGGGKEDCDPDDPDDPDCPVELQTKSGHDDDDDCDPDECVDLAIQQGDGRDDDDEECPSTTTTTSPSSTTTTEGSTTTTEDDIGPNELDFGDVGATCVGDIPYFHYEIEFPGATSATITFVNPNGADVVYTDVPMSGDVLWPGANDDPADWPGWILENGMWVAADDGYLWARETVEVIFEVNPTATLEVPYPQATEACADPSNTTRPTVPDTVGGVVITPPPPPGDEVGGVTELPFTGVDTGPLAAIAFGALALGSLLLVASRRDDIEET